MNTFDKYIQKPLTWIQGSRFAIQDTKGATVAAFEKPSSKDTQDTRVTIGAETWRFYRDSATKSEDDISRYFIGRYSDTVGVFEYVRSSGEGRLKLNSGKLLEWGSFADRKYYFKMMRQKMLIVNLESRQILLEAPAAPLSKVPVITAFALYLLVVFGKV